MVLKRGSNGADVAKLQAGLNEVLGLSLVADGAFGAATEDAVEAFQDKCDILSDGVAGPATLSRFNAAVSPAYQISAPIAAPAPEPGAVLRDCVFVNAPADRHPRIPGNNGGFASHRLRNDVAKQYSSAKADANAAGAVVTTAGGVRPLSAGGGKDQSATSLHYCGLAFDLSLPSGMQRLDDPYLVEAVVPLAEQVANPAHPDARRWRVWARANIGETRTVRAVLAAQKGDDLILTEQDVQACVVDLTAILASHGFAPIRARRRALAKLVCVEPGKFRGPGRYTALEWWHFQCTTSLVAGATTFGAALLRVYDLATIKANFAGWDVSKGAKWQVDWF